MGIHKECIANASKFESYFGGGEHGCACVAMGNQQYTLHPQIVFVPPRNLGRTPAYPINPTHGDIVVSDQQYQNNIHGYHLVKNIKISLNKIAVAAIDDQ